METINSLDKNIKFTMEIEKEGRLAYLDILLNRIGNGIECKVYRKPIASQAVIPANACAPLSYKEAAFKAYINRAEYICDGNNLEEEYNNIREGAMKYGYKRSFIENLIEKGKNRKKRERNMKREEKQYLAIEYFPHYFERIKYRLKRYGICLVAKSGMKLGSVVRKSLDPVPQDNFAGVYEIPYINSKGNRECYIGMTGRTFKKRRKEHEADVKYARETTALARKNNVESINILFGESRIIYRSQESFASLVRETIEIMTRKGDICNDVTSFTLPKVWTEFLE